MRKLTTSVLLVVLSSTFVVANAQQKKGDSIIKTTDIGEVIVTTALNIKKKNDAITGSNKVLSNDDVTRGGNSNAVMAMTGKVSGLQITVPNSSVSGQANINLRGQRSITASSGALVVIDGAPSTASIFQQLPPEIIESVNIIKGQQGSALYGQDGANGVIIVTTKKGTKSEKIQFTLTSNIDFSSVYKLPIIQNKYGQGIQDTTISSFDYNGTNWVPYENTSWGPLYSDPRIGGTMQDVGMPQQQTNGKWLKQVYSFKKDNIGKFFQTGVMFQNGVSMNVGGSDGYAFLSLNRVQNDFVVDQDQMKRNNVLFKAGKKLGKFRIDGTFNIIDENTSQTDSNLYDDLLQTPSNVEVRAFANSGLEGHWTAYGQNPYWTIKHVRYDNKSTSINAILNAAYNINDHISISYLANVLSSSVLGESHNDGYKFTTPYTGTGTGIDGLLFSDFGQADITSNYYKFISKRLNYYGDLLLNFDYNLTNNIGMKLNIGANTTDKSITNTTVGGFNLQIPGFYHMNNVGNPDSYSNLLNTQSRSRSVAAFANLDLNYQDYLFLNSTFRYESSSVGFTHDTDTGKISTKAYPYYSFGLSFVPTKAFESLKNGVMNYAKLTGSYTKVGSTAAISPYSTDEVTGLIPTGFPMTNSSFLINRNPTSPTISPEFSYTKEASILLGFFKDRITIGGAIYDTRVKDLITNGSASNTTGISTLRANIGDMTNKGVEFDLGLTPLKSKDFEWNISGSYSSYKSKVTALSAGVDEINMLSYTSPAVGIFARVGDEFPLIKGTKYQRDGEGHIIVDATGNPLKTSTFEVLGKVNPDYILGFNTSIRFKGLTLSGSADYRTGNSFVSMTKNLLGFTGALEDTADFDRSQGYIIPNSVQLVGASYVTNTTTVGNNPTYAGVTNYFTSGAYRNTGEEFVVDGTALKIREIALSYAIPKETLNSTLINSLTFGLYARNPFAWYAKSNRNFSDPETSNNTGSLDSRPGQALGTGGPNAYGIAFTGQYPTTRTFGFDVKITF